MPFKPQLYKMLLCFHNSQCKHQHTGKIRPCFLAHNIDISIRIQEGTHPKCAEINMLRSVSNVLSNQSQLTYYFQVQHTVISFFQQLNKPCGKIRKGVAAPPADNWHGLNGQTTFRVHPAGKERKAAQF